MIFANAFQFKNGTCWPALVSASQGVKIQASPGLAEDTNVAYTLVGGCAGNGKSAFKLG